MMNRTFAASLAASALSTVLFVSSEAAAAPPVQIRFLDVDSASFGSYVGVYGSGFGADQGSVQFGGATSIDVAMWTDRLIIARVPAGASTGKVTIRTASQEDVESPTTLSVHTGTIYVVSSNGSDAGVGDESDPFQSLHKALSVVQTGDTVLIRAGSYDEQDEGGTPLPALYLRAAQSGTTARPITWRGYGAEVPVIRGTRENAKDSPVLFVGADYIRMARLEVNGGNNTSNGVTITGTGVWAVGLQVHDFGGTGILAGEGAGVMVAGNAVRGGGTRPNLDHGIVLTGPGGTVRDNEVAELPNGGGILLQYPTQGTANVFANYVHDVAGSGIGLSRVSGGNRIFNNVVWRAGMGQGCQCGIQAAYGSAAGEASTGDRIYYNTVAGPTRTGVLVSDRDGAVELHNNLFAGFKVGVQVEDDASKAALSSSRNLWFGLGEDPQFKWGGPWLAFDAFQTASAQEADSFVSDPLLVDWEQGDLQLTTSSPALDVGSGPDKPLEDFQGMGRPQGSGYDLGAYELEGGAPSDGGTGGTGGATGDGGGAGGSGATGGSSADAGQDAAPAGAAGSEDSGGGCGCSVPRTRGSGVGAAILALIGVASWQARRRRSRDASATE